MSTCGTEGSFGERLYLAYEVDGDLEDCLLTWWREKEQLSPRVALGARYMLSIPATSVASERVFSSVVRKATKARARMTGANVEKTLFSTTTWPVVAAHLPVDKVCRDVIV